MTRAAPGRAGAAALLACILLGWVLALQPMVAGFAAAAMPIGEICRGLASGADGGDRPGHDDGHLECCLSGCASAASGEPPAPLNVRAPAAGFAPAPISRSRPWPLWRAGLGPQAARAPPHDLSV